MNEIEGFIAKIGLTYRILIPYAQERRLLLRMQVAKDASLYLFEDQPKKVFYGQGTIERGSKSKTVDITQGKYLDDASDL